MAMKLSDRLRANSIAKEQKRAERMSDVTMTSGPEICAKLATGRQVNRHGLERMLTAVKLFRDGGPQLDMALKTMSPAKRGMYRMAKQELKGEWMGMFEKLVSIIPETYRDRPFMMSWEQWLEVGMDSGMNEEQLVNALRVMLVFRDR